MLQLTSIIIIIMSNKMAQNICTLSDPSILCACLWDTRCVGCCFANWTSGMCALNSVLTSHQLVNALTIEEKHNRRLCALQPKWNIYKPMHGTMRVRAKEWATVLKCSSCRENRKNEHRMNGCISRIHTLNLSHY